MKKAFKCILLTVLTAVIGALINFFALEAKDVLLLFVGNILLQISGIAAAYAGINAAKGE